MATDEENKKVYIPEVVDEGSSFHEEKTRLNSGVRLGCLFSGLGYLLVMLAGFVIYVWTIALAYEVLGIVAAVISALLPVFAQIFWCLKFWSDTGTLLNPYSFVVISYFIFTIFARSGFGLFSSRRR